MSEAVAVFSSAGNLVITNVAYGDLWGVEAKRSPGADDTIAGIASLWQDRTAPTPFWADAKDLVTGRIERIGREEEARADGRAAPVMPPHSLKRRRHDDLVSHGSVRRGRRP